MKKFLILSAILLGSTISQAQDLITTKKGEAILAKILEVSSTEVRYKKFSNQDGPTFVLDKADILSIKYENGDEEIIETAPSLTSAKGEIYEGMKYSEYKDLYDTHFYNRELGGTYSPGWSGFASFFIPGLGQVVCDEWGRGLCFFAGQIALATLFFTSVNVGGTQFNVETRTGGDGPYAVAVLAALADVALDIWSICDAVHVAKVKNMYYQDLRGPRASVDLKLEPYFAYTPTSSFGDYSPTAGLSIRLNF